MKKFSRELLDTNTTEDWLAVFTRITQLYSKSWNASDEEKALFAERIQYPDSLDRYLQVCKDSKKSNGNYDLNLLWHYVLPVSLKEWNDDCFLKL